MGVTLSARNGARVELAVPTHDAQSPRPLRDQHAAVGQERESPRMLEPLCERDDSHCLELGSHHALGSCREGEHAARCERGEKTANGSSHHGSGNEVEHGSRCAPASSMSGCGARFEPGLGLTYTSPRALAVREPAGDSITDDLHANEEYHDSVYRSVSWRASP